MSQMKVPVLVVVSGGVATTAQPMHADVRVIDLDNIGQGDEPETLPRDIGFEALVEAAGDLVEGQHYVWGGLPVIAPQRYHVSQGTGGYRVGLRDFGAITIWLPTRAEAIKDAKRVIAENALPAFDIPEVAA